MKETYRPINNIPSEIIFNIIERLLESYPIYKLELIETHDFIVKIKNEEIKEYKLVLADKNYLDSLFDQYDIETILKHLYTGNIHINDNTTSIKNLSTYLNEAKFSFEKYAFNYAKTLNSEVNNNPDLFNKFKLMFYNDYCQNDYFDYQLCYVTISWLKEKIYNKLN